MICPICGTESSPSAQFCGECGTALISDAVDQTAPKNIPAPSTQPDSQSGTAAQQDWASTQPGSGWLKFVVYVLMPTCIFAQVAFSILYLTGSIWAAETGSTSLAYQYFPGLQSTSLIVGALYLLGAIITLIAEITLAQFKPFAPVLALVACGCAALAGVADVVLVSAAVGLPYARYATIVLIAIGIATLIANLLYFRTRKHWFAAGSPSYTLLGPAIWRRAFGTVLALLGVFALVGALSHVGDMASFSFSTLGMSLAMITGGIVMLVKK